MKVAIYESVDLIDVQGVSFSRLMQIMKIVLECAKGKTDMPDRKDHERGYFGLSKVERSEDGASHYFPKFTVPFGYIPNDVEEKYFFLSEEKGTRLNNNISQGHTTSFESRDPDSRPYGHWGGSVLCSFVGLNTSPASAHFTLSRFITFFSGMPELIDEAMMVSVGEIVAKLANLRMIETDAHTRNQYWRQIFDESWTTILTMKQKGLF